MKRKYMKPMMEMEEFMADEFVSSCAETSKKFVCDAPWGILYRATTPGVDGQLTNQEIWLGQYKQKPNIFGPCQYNIHEVDTSKQTFYDGRLYTDTSLTNYVNVIVYVEGEDTWHATRTLQISQWETNKS